MRKNYYQQNHRLNNFFKYAYKHVAEIYFTIFIRTFV